jgi:hypothetical protein
MQTHGTGSAYELFSGFEPVAWNPDESGLDSSGLIYSLRRDHGVMGTYYLHNRHDQINDGKSRLDTILLEYRIGHNSYPLYTMNDLLNAEYPVDAAAEGNVIGDIAERIARRVTKYWLKHFSPHGKTGGIFDKRFDPLHRNDFVIAHSDDYILKIRKYPNCVILKKSGKGKFGYENIKELDGLFDYRFFLQRHVIVLESKLEKISVNVDALMNNLFVPLRQLFPAATFTYVLFTDKHSIYQKRYAARRRQLKQLPLRIYEQLKSQGVGTLFFSFNESRSDFERMKDHLITQYRSLHKMGVVLKGKTVVSGNELVVFDGGETPHLKLIKDTATGMWKEVKLTHKKKR